MAKKISRRHPARSPLGPMKTARNADTDLLSVSGKQYRFVAPVRQRASQSSPQPSLSSSTTPGFHRQTTTSDKYRLRRAATGNSEDRSGVYTDSAAMEQ